MTTSSDEPHPDVAFVPANPVAASLRKGGDLLLTGRAEFLDDVAPAGLTHMALVRSPHPHAEIVGIDVTTAAGMPGVLQIATAEDIEGLAGVLPHFFDPTVVGCKTADFRCLATDKVRWVGDPVVAVIADTLAHAEAAADVVSIDYALLPHVLTAPDALAVDAPLLFAEWGDNVLGTFTFGEGDPDGHIVAAPHVLHEEFSVGRHQSAPMETRD